MWRVLRSILLVLGLAGLTSGCSVVMASSGEEEPQIHLVRVGSSRQLIEAQLGSPIRVTVLEDGGSRCEYRYRGGNQSSSNRAVGHAVFDVLTLGVWEVVGTGYELSRGKEFRAVVEYDSRNVARVVSFVVAGDSSTEDVADGPG